MKSTKPGDFNKKDHPVGKHFNLTGQELSDLIAIAIEKVVPEGDTILRRKRESYWIEAYDAVSFGANSRD